MKKKVFFVAGEAQDNKYGFYVGKFVNSHNISGSVYVVDESTLFIKDFSYDGTTRQSYFWVGRNSEIPNPEGTLVPYPDERTR